MATNKWSNAVSVNGPDGLVFDIRSARQAAEFLVIHWPDTSRSWKHLQAQIACLDVLEGKRDPEHAREAFEEAAREAGILV